jgi:hypothetical protein
MKRDVIHLHRGSLTAPLPDVKAERAEGPVGGFVVFEGSEHYRISAYHLMPPFLMTLASDTDLWMFVTSGGGLTAGRVDADGSIFPYETVDRLHDGHHHTGPITLIRVARGDGSRVLWQPFSQLEPAVSRMERSLYKSIIGNQLVFEEVNRDLDLTFRYRWAGSDEFGWVRTATLENRGPSVVSVDLLDGLRNVLPYGVPQSLSQSASNLVDAYKKAEVDESAPLAIFSLTAGICDRPEAVEMLRANTVWCLGLEGCRVHLAGDAVDAFRRGETPSAEAVLNGRRGNFLVTSSLELGPGDYSQWHTVADAGRSHAQIVALRRRILAAGDLHWEIEESLRLAGENLVRNVASADGIQTTGREEAAVHHFANVLFNNMRGGVFARNYEVTSADLAGFVRTRNRPTAERQAAFFDSLPDALTVNELLAAARKTGDADLERLCHEYLPIHFGRRHGDPSRPWNRFSIHVRNRDGSRALRYEGNWRDIFQNWEALCTSFPGFLPNVVAKFVNASTVDGFNPYRVTRDGLDWETPDPGDPWSHIGYWGDHQIIYLLKFLESMTRYLPGELEGLLRREIFSYADVPYRIKPYEDILEDPSSTIVYDTAAAARVDERVEALGTDGRLVPGPAGSVLHVSLLEKLLVPLLSKLSNLVPDGGIWMNTQRPEWNDANNALVGNGVSVVTLCYLRRYVAFLEELLPRMTIGDAAVSTEVVGWLREVCAVLARERRLLGSGTIDDRDRKRLLDELGEAFSEYRQVVYSRGFSGRSNLPVDEIAGLCGDARAFLEHGIRANRRDDGLYHSYVLLEVADDRTEAAVHPLQEMLEGQVAALSSGLPDAEEAVLILERLFESPLYRPEQKSFLLYPEKELPGFLEKNVIPLDRVAAVPLLNELFAAGEDSIVERDVSGVLRFQADLRNGDDLAAALDRLGEQKRWAESVARDRSAALDLYEDVFKHRSYTGRSGAMYAYEGLGSVYWHMVAKLLLAVQEVVLRAETGGTSSETREALAVMYYRIRSGLGFEKTPGEYGAFPTDPYSHTPPHGGAKQPGMTGQVKEEILTRLGELGVVVERGVVSFRPVLLRPDEFLGLPGVYRFYDFAGKAGSIDLRAGSLAFTFCQVPIVYERVAGEGWIRVVLDDGSKTTRPGGCLDESLSSELFGRSGRIAGISVGVPEAGLCRI